MHDKEKNMGIVASLMCPTLRERHVMQETTQFNSVHCLKQSQHTKNSPSIQKNIMQILHSMQYKGEQYATYMCNSLRDLMTTHKPTQLNCVQNIYHNHENQNNLKA